MNPPTNFLDRIINNRALTHVLFWLGVLFAAPIFARFNGQEEFEAFTFRAVGLPQKMLATYLLVYYQIPKLLQKKKYIQFLLSLAISVIVFSVVYRIMNIYVAETLAGADTPKEPISQILSELKWTVYYYYLRVYFWGFIFLLLKIVKDWAMNKEQVERLKKEKMRAELNFLKAQIHPHFLFNTLNNLYALTLKKSDEAPEVVAKLSEILDYMLYQCNEPVVAIHKEIKLLQNYVDLEKLRYGERLQLTFEEEVDDPNLPIAPLILLSIVENAFKHGASGTINQPLININLSLEDKQLVFKVYNSKSSIEQQDHHSYKEGIGVKNTLRQLDLIYKNRYSWKVHETETSYEVLVTIQL